MQNRLKWVTFVLVILTIILIPFMIFGNSIENWTNYFLNSSPSELLVAIVVGGLLSVDILAPVPSSIVSTAGGYFLGFILGTLVSFLGMTVSCIIGYILGAKLGNPISEKLVGKSEFSKLERLQNKYGDWIIIISRAVPVLAEASVLVAGIGRMSLKRFFLLILLSNLGISIAYAAIGAYSANVNSFLLAFAGAIVLPAIAMIVLKIKSK
ncbi:TVP38/TMEM64 family protein [Methanobacterium sp. ACI-7]|uniref:TVP38/TMEM64 family protein n=1 Tax=unclassified Methanobacterium TaxID=2627676 RepID=UPI0039C03AEF